MNQWFEKKQETKKAMIGKENDDRKIIEMEIYEISKETDD